MILSRYSHPELKNLICNKKWITWELSRARLESGKSMSSLPPLPQLLSLLAARLSFISHSHHGTARITCHSDDDADYNSKTGILKAGEMMKSDKKEMQEQESVRIITTQSAQQSRKSKKAR